MPRQVLRKDSSPGSCSSTWQDRPELLPQGIGTSLRRKVVAHTDAGSPSNQFGGRRGAQPVFLNRAVRAFLSQAHARARSSAILHVDVQSAFYKVLREAAVGPYRHNNSFLNVVERLDLPSHVKVVVISLVHDKPDAVPPIVLGQLQDMMRGTWVSDPGSSRVAKTELGSRPGTPLADVVFNLAIARVLRSITHS